MPNERRAKLLGDDEIADLLARIDASFTRHSTKNTTDIAVIKVEQTGYKEKLVSNSVLLEKHITECAKLQKYAFALLLFLAGFTVATYPKTGELMQKLLERLL